MPLNDSQPQAFAPGTQLRHYKSGLYTVVGSCLIEATLQPGVLYKPLQGDSQDVLWLRPLAEFHDQISTDAGPVPRFMKIADQPEKTNARTEAALARLHQAMREIEADIHANNGIYPFNYGRVTQSELCRRADVKKATLQNPVHKDSTRVEIIKWLDALNAKLMQTRDSTRERVTAVADKLTDELTRWTQACQRAEERLAKAELLIEQLRAENDLLKKQQLA